MEYSLPIIARGLVTIVSLLRGYLGAATLVLVIPVGKGVRKAVAEGGQPRVAHIGIGSPISHAMPAVIWVSTLPGRPGSRLPGWKGWVACPLKLRSRRWSKAAGRS
jgi:hypothetical protein